MKQTTKILFVLLLVLGLNTEAWTQDTDNADITATANVVTAVDVQGIADLVFGNVTPGNTKTIDFDGNVEQGTATGGEQAGQFTVSKGADTQITLSFTLPDNLDDGAGTLLPINFDAVSGELAKLAQDGSTDVPFAPADGIVIENTVDTEDYFASNTFDVFIGGTVVPATGQVDGTYTGTITLTATYN